MTDPDQPELPLSDMAMPDAPPPDAPPPDNPPPVITTSMMAVPDDRVEFERGMSYAPRTTLALFAVLIGVFLWQLASGALANQETIVGSGALEQSHVYAGEAWRLVTATLLHGSPDHLIGNLIVLFIVGMGLEHALGSRQMLAVYVAAGLAGSLLSTVMSPGPSVGASGAIFGVLAGLVVVLYRHRDRIVVRDHRVAIVLAAWAAWQIFNGLLTPYIDNMAHIGGAIGGAAAAWFTEPVLFSRERS